MEELQNWKEELEKDNVVLRKERDKSKKELEMWQQRMQRVKIQLKRMKKRDGQGGPIPCWKTPWACKCLLSCWHIRGSQL